MNADVTVRTVLILRTGHIVSARQRLNAVSFATEGGRAIVTFQAHCENDGPAEES